MTDHPDADLAGERDEAARRFAAAGTARLGSWLASSGYAERTGRTYQQQASRYLRWLAGQPELARGLRGVVAARWFVAGPDGQVTAARWSDGELDEHQAAADRAAGQYQEYLIKAGTAAAGVKLAMAAIGALYRAIGLRSPQVTGRVSTRPDPRPRALSSPQRARVLAAARKHGVRDHTIAVLAVEAGLRPSEIVALDLDDLAVTDKDDVAVTDKFAQINVRDGVFGHRARVVVLTGDDAVAVLGQWKSERAAMPGSDTALLVSRYRRRISLRTAEHIIQQIGAEASVRLSLVMLRHTAGIRLASRGARRHDLAQWLGHARPDTARRYEQDMVQQSSGAGKL